MALGFGLFVVKNDLHQRALSLAQNVKKQNRWCADLENSVNRLAEYVRLYGAKPEPVPHYFNRFRATLKKRFSKAAVKNRVHVSWDVSPWNEQSQEKWSMVKMTLRAATEQDLFAMLKNIKSTGAYAMILEKVLFQKKQDPSGQTFVEGTCVMRWVFLNAAQTLQTNNFA